MPTASTLCLMRLHVRPVELSGLVRAGVHHTSAGLTWSFAYAAFVLLCGFAAYRSAACRWWNTKSKIRRAQARTACLCHVASAAGLRVGVAAGRHQPSVAERAPIPLLWVLPLSVYCSPSSCVREGRLVFAATRTSNCSGSSGRHGYITLSENAYYELPVKAGVAVLVTVSSFAVWFATGNWRD